MTTITTGIFRRLQTADAAITMLKKNDVVDSDISCVYTDANGEIKDSESDEKISSGAVKGVATGAVIGTIAGLVVANGILPGIGTLFVAGPIATALGFTGAVATTVAGAATGAAAGGLLGALGGYGVSKEDAILYEDYIRKGGVLVIAKNEDKNDNHIVEIFEDFGAEEIRQYNHS